MAKYRVHNTDVYIEEQGGNKLRLLQTSKLYKLSKIRSNEGTIKSIINCSYFNASGGYVLGRNQGDMFNNTHDQSGFYDLVFLKDGTYKLGQFKSWDWCNHDEVLAGFSVAGVLMLSGADCELVSDAIVSLSKLTTKAPQTALAVLKTGEVLQIVSDGRTSANAGITGHQLRTFIKSKYDVDLLVLLDGGGSSEMIVDGVIVNKPSDGTERGMFNGFAFIECDEPEDEEEIQEPEQNVQKDEQNIQGSEGTMKGIDISKWQGDIDLKTLKAKNKLDFVIIRAGYAQTVDPKAKRNMDLCESLGIPYGVYWYSYATSKESALKEAQACEKALSGRKLLFPIFYDIEDKTLPKGAKLRDIVKLFCEYFEGRGYYAGVYASKSWFEDVNRLNHADIDKFDKWVAQWADKCTYSKPFGMWQYTDKGRLTGYSGNLDMNEARRDYPAIIKSKGLNGWKVEEKPSCNCAEEIADLKAENAELKKQLNIWQTLVEKIKGLLK